MLLKLKDVCVSDLRNNLGSDPIKNFAIERFISRIDKKFTPSSLEFKNLDELTRKNFHEINGRIRLPFAHSSRDKLVLGEAKDFIYYVLENYTSKQNGTRGCVMDFHHLQSLWAYGPGASHGVSGISAAEKLTTGTVTSTCLPYARALVLNTLKDSFFSFEEIRGSKLSTVQKNSSTNRSICTEPSLNMAVQKSLGNYIAKALAYVGLDLRDQQAFNQKLALEASKSDSGLCTIDMKNASDMISPSLVKALFPHEWYSMFMACRSEFVLDGKSWHKLNMISTMGNGYTFQMMTLIFSALVYALDRVYANAPRHKWRGRDLAYGVYGDDVIIEKDLYDLFCKNALSWGLDINETKSYKDGFFKESCGCDAYHGFDVTPVYVADVSSVPAIYVAINQLTNWSVRQAIDLSLTVSWLMTLLKQEEIFYVPLSFDSASGIQTPECRSNTVKCLTFKGKNVMFQPRGYSHYMNSILYGGSVSASDSNCLRIPDPEMGSWKVEVKHFPFDWSFKTVSSLKANRLYKFSNGTFKCSSKWFLHTKYGVITQEQLVAYYTFSCSIQLHNAGVLHSF